MSVVAQSANIGVYEAAPIVLPGKPKLLSLDILANALANINGVGAANFTTYAVTGNSPVLTVPAGKKWIVKSVYMSLTTSATVVQRRASVLALSTPGANLIVLGIGSAQITQAANLTQNYMFGKGITAVGALIGGTSALVSFPECAVPAGGTVQDNTVSEQAGDSVTLIVNVIELPS